MRLKLVERLLAQEKTIAKQRKLLNEASSIIEAMACTVPSEIDDTKDPDACFGYFSDSHFDLDAGAAIVWPDLRLIANRVREHLKETEPVKED